jgi:hypothetical protein
VVIIKLPNPRARARLLISEFEKLKVQIIYGVLVGAHPPTPLGLAQSQPTRGTAWRRCKFYLVKNAHFSELNSPAGLGANLVGVL